MTLSDRAVGARRRTVAAVLGLSSLCAALFGASAPQAAEQIPIYTVDLDWPKPFPDAWGELGEVAGQAVDSDGHIWIIHRGFGDPSPPPVIEFDAEGNILQAWGGAGAGYTWPDNEHGLFVDADGNVWTAGSTHQLLKFSHTGEFLLAIGKAGQTGGNEDTSTLGSAANLVVDPVRNEVYVADGYGNQRVIVFDSNTGAYKRHWGAYGESPSTFAFTPRGFGLPVVGPVHCINLSADGLVYVCDRDHYRIQVFQRDGTFVREFFIRDDGAADPAALAGLCTPQCGPAFDVAFSPDPEQRLMFVAVAYEIAPANSWQPSVFGNKEHVFILNRQTGELLGRFGGAGPEAGHFDGLHGLTIDRDGSIYTGEISKRRVQRFVVT